MAANKLHRMAGFRREDYGTVGDIDMPDHELVMVSWTVIEDKEEVQPIISDSPVNMNNLGEHYDWIGKSMVMDTVGWLVRDDNDSVVLAHTCDGSDIRGHTRIPKILIRDRIIIHPN